MPPARGGRGPSQLVRTIGSERGDTSDEPGPTPPPRWSFARVPGVLRAADRELLHRDGAADQRDLRVHRDADQRPARREADAPRGGVRPGRADVPARAVGRVQGEPPRDARGLPQSAQPDLRGARRARHQAAVRAGLRGRRPHRDAGHPGRCRGHGRADRDRRPGRAPAGLGPGDGADDQARHQRHDPVHPGNRGREVRADPGAVPRLRRPARRPERQPARHSRRGGEDRHQVDRGVRLAGRPGRPGGRGQGQGRRRAARAPRQRAAQPPAHHTGHRPAGRDRRRGTRRPAAGGLGPGQDPPALRLARVQGAPRAPLPDPPRTASSPRPDPAARRPPPSPTRKRRRSRW